VVALRLQLDNVTNLPDGGPTSIEVQGRRSIDIGRNTYLDWTLPDPSRVVSGRHCEIHYRDGGYWITDISTNGTYLNGSDKRLTEPTRLKSGDRITIGDYIINVAVEEDDAPSRTVEAPPDGPPERASASLWDVPDDVAAPAEPPAARRARQARPVHPDALDWIADIPPVRSGAPAAQEHAGVRAEPLWDEGAHSAPAARGAPAREAPQTGWPDKDRPAEASGAPAGKPAEAGARRAEPIATLGGDARARGRAHQQPDDLWAPPEPAAAPAAGFPGEQTPEPEAHERDGDREADGEAAPQPGTAATPAAAPVPPTTPPEPEDAPARSLPVRPAAHEVRAAGGFSQAAHAAGPRPAEAGDEAFERFVAALAEALDVPRDRLEAGMPEELAARIGQFVHLTIAGMQRLLKARAASRGYMRSGPGTQVQAVGNNPLKFMPTPGAAADVLFGPPSRSYLDVENTLEESFSDLGSHQMALYAAMQGAVERMLKDLDPAAIEGTQPEARGFAIPGVSSRKAKLWDTYKERYNARASQHDNGMVDVFMLCFSEAYQRAMRERS